VYSKDHEYITAEATAAQKSKQEQVTDVVCDIVVYRNPIDSERPDKNRFPDRLKRVASRQ
jgi:hypothetical protein